MTNRDEVARSSELLLQGFIAIREDVREIRGDLAECNDIAQRMINRLEEAAELFERRRKLREER